MLSQVAEGVLNHQSELLLNNAVVVQGRTGVLLVDAGITGAEMACLANDLRELGRPVAAGFSTHADWDHVLWHPDLGDAPRYATARSAAAMQELLADPEWRTRVTEGLPPEIADETPLDGFGLLTALPDGTTHVPWDGPAVRIIEHDAHAPGHATLLVEETGALIAGDMLSDLFVPMLDMAPADPIGDYLAALDLFDAVASDVTAVIPGHGSAGDAAEYRARIDLDRAYVLALRDGGGQDDPRLGPSVKEGWEWVVDIHTGQAQSLSQKGQSAG